MCCVMPINDKSIKDMINSDHYGAIQLDSNGIIVDANNLFLRHMRYDWKDVIGTPFLELLPSTIDREAFRLFNIALQHTSCLEIKKRGSFLKKIALADSQNNAVSTEVITYIYSSAADGEACENDCMIIVFKSIEDVTEQKIIEQARRSLTDDMDLGFKVMDAKGKIIEINDQAARYYGSSREKFFSDGNEDVLSMFPEEYFFCRSTLKTGIPFRNHTVSWKVDDRNRSFVVDTIMLRDSNKEVIGAAAFLKDISTVKSLELQIQHNERLAMIGQIAAGAAHEIRNPITSIKGFLQLLRRNLKGKMMDKEVGYTDVMLSEIDRITELLNEFLLLSKPRELTVTTCRPADIVSLISPMIEAEALLQEVDIVYNVEETPDVKVDKELMKQVFLNIAKNAIEAMVGSKGSLTISISHLAKERMVVIGFKDTGPGIPAYIIDKIFDPFFTTKESGTGLGLSVCQRIVSELGGSMKVASKGYGTTFTVYLPEVKEDV